LSARGLSERLPLWASGEESAFQCKRCGFDQRTEITEGPQGNKAHVAQLENVCAQQRRTRTSKIQKTETKKTHSSPEFQVTGFRRRVLEAGVEMIGLPFPKDYFHWSLPPSPRQSRTELCVARGEIVLCY